MAVTIKINSLVGRIVLAAVLMLAGIASAEVITSHYLVRTVADRRVVMGREALAAAATKLPNSPRVQLRLGEVEMAEPAFDARTQAQAQAHATSAINLSPWDYRPWRLLAAAQESDGRPEEAEKSLAAAAKLAPSNVEVRWTLANLLLRQGRLNESLGSFKVAVTGNSELLPAAFDLLWQASNGDLSLLKTAAGGDAKSLLVLAQFLADHSQTDAGINTYRSIDPQERLKSLSAAYFISSLIQAGRLSAARELWLNTVAPSTDVTVTDAIWNGGFEQDLLKEFAHFDWTIAPSDYARIGFDRGVARGGAKSLKLTFAGRDTTKLEGEVKQLVVFKPNARYRLECYAKASNLVTPEGPKLALLWLDRTMTVSGPVQAGSTDWQLLEVDFTSPPDRAAAFVTIVRIPRFSYDEPTRGTVWFDDFKLTKL